MTNHGEIILNESRKNKIVKRSKFFNDNKAKKVNRKGSLWLPYGMEFVSMRNRSWEECVCMYGTLGNPTIETYGVVSPL